MLTFNVKGSFKRTDKALKKMSRLELSGLLDRYGQMGVQALSSATPVDSGLTATSWGYKITKSRGATAIVWTNSNVVNGVPIAVIIQYGHGTGTGGYVQGRDYINPAIRPIFDKISEELRKGISL